MITAKLKLKKATKRQTLHTSRMGTIHASYNELVKILGEPHDCVKDGVWKSEDNKVRVEWAFLINNNKNLVFTIYDYKSRYALSQIKQWSLGGKSEKVKFFLEKELLVE